MHAAAELRIEPPPGILAGARQWLDPVRTALGSDFLAAYLSGSVLSQGFDPAHSHVNVLVLARELGPETLDRIARAILPARKAPHYEALFFTRRQIEKSLDAFPIEWLDIFER